MFLLFQSRISPIIAKGLYDIKPKNRWYRKPGTVDIIVEDPIETDDKTVEELLKETHKIFTNHLNS